MRTELAAASVLGALLVPSPGYAQSNSDTCPGAGPGVHPYTFSTGGAAFVAGVCLDRAGATTVSSDRYDGGEIEAGADTNDGAVPIVGKPGFVPAAYVVADGDNDNADPSGNDISQGYVGLSNHESASPENDCPVFSADADGDDGSGTNSGGCVTVTEPVVDEVPELGLDGEFLVAVPAPFVACGNRSGDRWNSTPRDGCLWETGNVIP